MENSARASPRSRQQRRSGSPSPQEENAARRGVPGNEAAAQLRETLGAPRPRKGRSGPPLSQTAAQAHGARGILTPTPDCPCAPRLRSRHSGRCSQAGLSGRAPAATFVLVHGAWHGGWCYKEVAHLLRQAGHEVYTPTLTGLGERAHLMSRTIDLSTHIEDILAVIRCENLSDVVLCGHSYGGMVIAGVAEQIADKLRTLVFLDAFVPENGKSLSDYLPTEQVEHMRADAAQNGDGYKVTPPPVAFFRVNPQDEAWINAMCG